MGRSKTVFIIVITALFSCTIHAQEMETRLDQTLAALHKARVFNGAVLVAKGNDIILRKGYGTANMEWNVPVTPETRFRIGSVTKQFTASIILKLMEEGKIDLQAKLRNYIPEYPSSQADDVTIHMLLNHTSGIPSYTSLPGFMERNTRLPYPPDSMFAVFAHLPYDFEPGSRWQYNNSGYFILGSVIEHVTGKPYDEVLREFLLQPLVMNGSGYEHNEDVIPQFAGGYVRIPGGYQRAAWLDATVPYAAGMMYSTVDDLYHWTRALHAGQVFANQKTFEMMTTPYMQNYGYGLMIHTVKAGEKDVRVVEHGGGIFGFRAALWYLPEEEYTIVVLDNTEGRADFAANAAFRILHGLDVEFPKPSIAEEMQRVIDADGIGAAEKRYADLKKNESGKWNFDETELNTLGYLYLRAGKTDIALNVFKMNIDAYPKSSNPYDSYGEALAKAGRKDEAIAMYQKALEINPGSAGAKAALERLGAKVEEKAVNITPELLDRYVGRYELKPGFVLEVTREGTQLFTQATGQSRFEIFPSTETTFYLKVVEAQITFETNGDAPSPSLTLHQNGRDMPAKRVK
ncbi:MAG: serine hydrolase [Bacteroidetes bacterium]|nr:serine hydrolase [Bacteroidota bacterium]